MNILRLNNTDFILNIVEMKIIMTICVLLLQDFKDCNITVYTVHNINFLCIVCDLYQSAVLLGCFLWGKKTDY